MKSAFFLAKTMISLLIIFIVCFACMVYITENKYKTSANTLAAQNPYTPKIKPVKIKPEKIQAPVLPVPQKVQPEKIEAPVLPVPQEIQPEKIRPQKVTTPPKIKPEKIQPAKLNIPQGPTVPPKLR